MRRVAEACVEVVVVVGARGSVPELPDGVPVRVARDAVEGAGPLAGILAGLGSVETEWALLAAGDMPELSSSVLRALTSAATSDVDAVVVLEGESLRPFPAAVRVARAMAEADARLRRGDASVVGMLGALRRTAVAEVTWRGLDPAAHTLRDIDVPDDLLG